MRSLLVALLVPSILSAQAARVPGITAAEIDGYLRFLSSDLLEGRAPATRGGRLAAEYIASQLRAFGLRPGLDTSYFQTVPIDVVTADRAPGGRVPTSSRRRSASISSSSSRASVRARS